jgi:hypothetical protein
MEDRMATKNSKLMAKQDESMIKAPDYLQRIDSAPALGFENMDRTDMTLPRLGLCQSGSPQRKRSDPKFIDGLSEGDYFNTITHTVYGPKLNVVPLMFWKARILFRDMEQGGGLLCQAPDNLHGVGEPGGECAKCPLSQFKNGAPPECLQFYNYAVLIPQDGKLRADSLAAFSLKSTGLSVAKDWNALMRLRNTDMFAGLYELSSRETKDGAYTWFASIVENAGWVDKAAYDFAREAYASVREFAQAGSLKVDVEDLGREPGAEG